MKLINFLKRNKDYLVCILASILGTIVILILTGNLKLNIANDSRLNNSKAIFTFIAKGNRLNKCNAEFSEYLKDFKRTNINNIKYSKEVGLFLLANNQDFNTKIQFYNDLKDFSAHQICIAVLNLNKRLETCTPEEIEEFEDVLRFFDDEELLQKSLNPQSNIVKYSLSEWGKAVFSTLYYSDDRTKFDLKYRDTTVLDFLHSNSGYKATDK